MRRIRLTAVRAVTMMTLLATGVYRADAAFITAHNGTVDSTPPGTGAVNVSIREGVANPPDGVVFTLGKVFHQFITHTLTADYPQGTQSILISDFVVNDTDVSWSDFHVDLDTADFFGPRGGVAPVENPVKPFPPNDLGEGDEFLDFGPVAGSISLAGSMLGTSDFGGTGAKLTIDFDDPVDPGESFQLRFEVHATDERATSFTMRETPTRDIVFPEPSGLMSLGTGLAGLLVYCLRRAMTRLSV